MAKNFIIKKEEKNFTIKKFGQPGLPGVKGDKGDGATITVGTVTSGEIPSITNVGTNTEAIFNFVLAKGDKGDDGASSTLQNVGEGSGIWKETVGSIASLKSLISIDPIISIYDNENTIDIGIDSRALNSAIYDNIQGINEQLALLQSEIDTNANNIDTINTLITNINNSIDTINTSISDLSTIRSNISTNTTNIASNTSDISNLQNSITSINNSINTINTSISDLSTIRSNIATNTTNIASNTSAINTNTSDISGLTTRMTTAESNISTNTTNITNNTNAINTNTTNIATNTSNISNLQSKVLPSGGTTGQILQKVNGTDYNVTWTTPSSSVSEGSGSGGTNASNVYSKNGLAVNTTGTRNNAFGYNSLLSNTTGNDNIAIGYSALQNNISNNNNVAIGSYALMNNTQNNNIAIGFQALRYNTTGQQNIAIGHSASYQLTTGQQNTVIGYLNNTANTTGGWNTIIGTNNNNANTKGGVNTIIGCENVTTLNDTTNNKPQIAIGNGNLKALIGGSTGAEYNIAIGWSCLLTTTLGRNNIAIGQNAMVNNNTGEESVAIGKLSFSNGGSKNTGLGFNAGSNGTYTNSVAIGAYTLQTNQTVSNVTAIGYQADVTGSNQVQLGNSATSTYAFGAIQNRSDARDKANIRDIDKAEEFFDGLQPKQWQWNYRSEYREITKDNDNNIVIINHENDGSKTRTRFHNGFIAQDIKELMDRLGIDFGGYQDHSKNGGEDVLSLGYEEFIPFIVHKVQKQDEKIKSQQTIINDLISRIEKLEGK